MKRKVIVRSPLIVTDVKNPTKEEIHEIRTSKNGRYCRKKCPFLNAFSTHESKVPHLPGFCRLYKRWLTRTKRLVRPKICKESEIQAGCKND